MQAINKRIMLPIIELATRCELDVSGTNDHVTTFREFGELANIPGTTDDSCQLFVLLTKVVQANSYHSTQHLG